MSPKESRPDLDAIIIGAGFGGLYQLHVLRQAGLKARIYDRAGGVGGTWWYNRYPGACVDFPGGPLYCYTFSEELAREWRWTKRYPEQPEVLAYLQHVAEKLDLYPDITLNTTVTGARFDEARSVWQVALDGGQAVTARYLVCAVGALSAAYRPDIPGLDDFAGELHHTGHWPHTLVSFEGKRVGIIGTGSSGVQTIPQVARRADHLSVFQRTPQYVLPARQGPLDEAFAARMMADWDSMRARSLQSLLGVPLPMPTRSALAVGDAERQSIYEAGWQEGGLSFFHFTFTDIMTDARANHTLAEFVRGKIRQIVKDPETARKLLPDYYLGTKRQVLGDDYYETFNRSNVTLVDLRADPIERITAGGVRTAAGEHPLDMLILATGFDALSGPLLRINPVGRGGKSLAEHWQQGFDSYLGLTIPEMPNLFMIHGPGSPSVLFNMPMGAELQAEWIRDCLRHLEARGITTIEPEPASAREWGERVAAIADQTLFPQADSWYAGANIPGKPRQFTIHLNGPEYHARLREVAEGGFPGFVMN